MPIFVSTPALGWLKVLIGSSSILLPRFQRDRQSIFVFYAVRRLFVTYLFLISESPPKPDCLLVRTLVLLFKGGILMKRQLTLAMNWPQPMFGVRKLNCCLLFPVFAVALFMPLPDAIAQPHSVPYAAKADNPTAPGFHGDINYATHDGAALMLDVILPKNDRLARPVVIILHGTGFSKGRPGVRKYAKALAESGYVAVLVGFPHESKDAYPAALNDFDASVDWVCANARLGPPRTGQPSKPAARGSLRHIHIAQCSTLCRSSTLAEKAEHLLAIAEPSACKEASIFDAYSFPCPPTLTFYTLL